MKNVKQINFNNLTNEGFVGFHSYIIKGGESINLEEVKPLLELYKSSLRKFTEYTTSVTEKLIKKEYSKLHEERTDCFRGFRNLVGVYKDPTGGTLSRMCGEIWEHVKNFSNIGSLDHKRVSGIMENVIENVHMIVEKESFREVFSGSELERRFSNLEKLQTDFSVTNQLRTNERRIRMETTSMQLRSECINVYFQLVNVVQYNGQIKGDEDCNIFIDKINLFIKNSRSLYTNRKKKLNKPTEPSNDTGSDAATTERSNNAA